MMKLSLWLLTRRFKLGASILFLGLTWLWVIFSLDTHHQLQRTPSSRGRGGVNRSVVAFNLKSSNLGNQGTVLGSLSTKMVPIVVALCGQHVTYSNLEPGDLVPSKSMRELKTMVKTLLLTEYSHIQRLGLQNVSNRTLDLIIFVDNQSTSDYLEDFLRPGHELAAEYLSLLGFKIRTPVYPKKYEFMKSMLYPCATFRLLLGLALPDLDAILYLDTDVILRKPAREIFDEVYSFTEHQWSGMGPAMYHTNENKNLPYFGVQGLSSGVSVFNLTKMRKSALLTRLPIIYKRYTRQLPDADQDILNVYFHSRPNEVRLLGCGIDFIQYFCFPNPLCGGYVPNGITVIHGCSNAFFRGGPRSHFSLIFEAYEKLNASNVNTEAQIREFNLNLKYRLEANRNLIKYEQRNLTYETSCTKHPYFIQNLFYGIID